MFPDRLRASAFAFILLVGPDYAAAQTVRAADKDQVSVHAEGARLGDLLRKLAKLGPVDQLLIDEDVEDAPVTLNLESVPFSEAMIEVLQAANVNYVLHGGNGNPYQVYAGRGGSARGSVAPGGVGAGYSDYEEPEPEPEYYEEEDPFPEISGDARLPVAPGSGRVALAGTLLLFGLVLGHLAVGRRFQSAPRGNFRSHRPLRPL